MVWMHWRLESGFSEVLVVSWGYIGPDLVECGEVDRVIDERRRVLSLQFIFNIFRV